MPVYLDSSPTEAVVAARRDAEAGAGGVYEALDRALRWHLLRYLQERLGELSELRRALIQAADWAGRERQPLWDERWAYLLELLRDAGRQPATAVDLQMLEAPVGRAAEVLAFLAESERPLRPSEVAERLKTSLQHVRNLIAKLESADLVVRRKGEGRSTWIFTTPRGQRLSRLLPQTPKRAAPSDAELAPEALLWREEKLDESVVIH